MTIVPDLIFWTVDVIGVGFVGLPLNDLVLQAARFSELTSDPALLAPAISVCSHGASTKPLVIFESPQRDLNIALVNELEVIFRPLGSANAQMLRLLLSITIAFAVPALAAAIGSTAHWSCALNAQILSPPTMAS